jgi:hypothetical protein
MLATIAGQSPATVADANPKVRILPLDSKKSLSAIKERKYPSGTLYYFSLKIPSLRYATMCSSNAAVEHAIFYCLCLV